MATGVPGVEMVSNASVARLARKLAHQVQDSGYRPDIIICIARGGYVPARLLCDHLDIYNLASLRIKHYTGAEKAAQAELIEPLAIDIRGLKVLLVDDVDDTGDTLRLALDNLAACQPAEIRTAVLHHKLTSEPKPDYYGHKVIRWRWITYPWAAVEDVLGFVKKLQPRPATVTEALHAIETGYGIKVSKQVMEDVFRLL